MKKKNGSYSSVGLKIITNSVVVGSIPNISGTSSESNMKSKYVEGLGNIGNKLPVMGNITGTRMISNQTNKLSNKNKKYKKGLF